MSTLRRRFVRRPPLRECACGCGRRVASYREVAWASGHAPSPVADYTFELPDGTRLEGLTLYEYLDAKNGRCVVCHLALDACACLDEDAR